MSDLSRRVSLLETTLRSKPWKVDRYSAAAQRGDKDLREEVVKLAKRRETFFIGAISATVSIPGYVSPGAEVVTRAWITVDTDHTEDTTDFWTLGIYRRALGETYGHEVGDPHTTERAGLTAREPWTLYDDALGAELAEGEVVLLSATLAAAGVALSGVFVTLELQRKVG